MCVCVCVCYVLLLLLLFRCDFSVDLSIIHNTAGHYESLRGTLCCEIAEMLCLCQALTWTPLQSPPLRADILERLAWAEIADDGQRCVARSQQGSYLKSRG